MPLQAAISSARHGLSARQIPAVRWLGRPPGFPIVSGQQTLHPAALKAYRRELRGVARGWRYSGILLAVIGAARMATSNASPSSIFTFKAAAGAKVMSRLSMKI